MGLKFVDLVIPLMLNLVHSSISDNFLPCDGAQIGQCVGPHLVCNVETQRCECDSLGSYVRVGDECVHKGDVIEPNNVGITVALSLLAVSLIVIGLVLVARKYDLVGYVREKINAHRNNSNYEDVMIGQDDPPISL